MRFLQIIPFQKSIFRAHPIIYIYTYIIISMYLYLYMFRGVFRWTTTAVFTSAYEWRYDFASSIDDQRWLAGFEWIQRNDGWICTSVHRTPECALCWRRLWTHSWSRARFVRTSFRPRSRSESGGINDMRTRGVAKVDVISGAERIRVSEAFYRGAFIEVCEQCATRVEVTSMGPLLQVAAAFSSLADVLSSYVICYFRVQARDVASTELQ